MSIDKKKFIILFMQNKLTKEQAKLIDELPEPEKLAKTHTEILGRAANMVVLDDLEDSSMKQMKYEDLIGLDALLTQNKNIPSIVGMRDFISLEELVKKYPIKTVEAHDSVYRCFEPKKKDLVLVKSNEAWKNKKGFSGYYSSKGNKK